MQWQPAPGTTALVRPDRGPVVAAGGGRRWWPPRWPSAWPAAPGSSTARGPQAPEPGRSPTWAAWPSSWPPSVGSGRRPARADRPPGLALVLGVADDAVDLPPLVRLVGQVAIGVSVAAVVPTHAGRSGSAACLVVAVTVLVINGVNLIDGLDILAGGVAAVAAVGFAAAPRRRPRPGPGPGRGAGRLPRLQPAAGPDLPGRRRLLPAGHRPDRAAGRRPGRPGARTAGRGGRPGLVAVPVAEVAFAVVRRLRGRRSLARRRPGPSL